MSPLLRKILGMNWYLTGALAVLLLLGIEAIAIAGENNPSPSIQVAYKTQTNWILLGLVAYFVISFVDYKWIRWAAAPAMLVGLALLVLALVHGEEINDTKGWLTLGGLTFQPSQFAMGAAIIAASVALGELRRLHKIFRQPFVNLAMIGFLMGVPCLLVLSQGDVGSALVWLPVSASLCLVGNIPFRHIFLVVLAAMTVLPLFYFFGLNDARRSRIEVYLDMLNGRPVDIRGQGYSAYYASTAVGSGGWNGFGHKSRQNKDNPAMIATTDVTHDKSLDERKNSIHAQGLISRTTAHTDYIFAVWAERFGFRGAMWLIALYSGVLAICLIVAYSSRDLTGRLVVTGVAALIFAHVFQNIGMNILLTPITGIPLPFISYGGTFVVVILSMLGLVQSVWVHRDPDLQEEPEPQKEVDGVQNLLNREAR